MRRFGVQFFLFASELHMKQSASLNYERLSKEPYQNIFPNRLDENVGAVLILLCVQPIA